MIDTLKDKIEDLKDERAYRRNIQQKIEEIRSAIRDLDYKQESMIWRVSKIKVMEGTKGILEKEYEEFMKSVVRNRIKSSSNLIGIGNIIEYEKPEFLSDNLISKAIVRYTVLEFRDEYSMEDYEQVEREKNELKTQLEKYEGRA